MLIGLSLDHRRADLEERERFLLPETEHARLGRAVRRACGAQVAFLSIAVDKAFGRVGVANKLDKVEPAAHSLLATDLKLLS